MRILALLLATACFAKPTVERSATAVTVTNQHLRLTCDATRGGWPVRLQDAGGRVWIDGGRVYTDVGLFEGRRAVGSWSEPQPALAVTEQADAVTVTASGALRPAPEDPLPATGIGYEVAVTIADQPTVALRVRLTPHRDFPAGNAFLAAVLVLPQTTEWFASTVDGLVNARAEGDGRTFQSSLEPLDPATPRFGVVYQDGRILTFDQVRTTAAPLSNAFLHQVGTTANAFLALLDGQHPTAWPRAEVWELTALLRLTP